MCVSLEVTSWSAILIYTLSHDIDFGSYSIVVNPFAANQDVSFDGSRAMVRIRVSFEKRHDGCARWRRVFQFCRRRVLSGSDLVICDVGICCKAQGCVLSNEQ